MKNHFKKHLKIKLFLILLLTLKSNSLFSQNREPNQHQFMLNGVATYLSTDLEYFNINKFILGWHWGDEYKISQALKMNQTDIGSYENFKINSNNNLFIRSVDKSQSPHLAFATHCYYEPDAIYGKSLQYDPTLFIDKSNVYKLNKREGDPSNPIFGFLNKRGRILTNSDSANYSRIIIDSAALKDKVILSEPWPSSIMYYTSVSEKYNPIIDSLYSGRSFYISINLRRYLNSTASDSTPVLKIKVPYVYWKLNPITEIVYKDSLYAAFDSIPSFTNNDTTNLANNYGKIWDLMVYGPGSTKPREIIITRKMLPIGTNDITISGYINFGGLILPEDDLSNNNRNHKLKHLPHLHSETFNEIDSLKIEVTYLDTMQVAIDWVRFETPNARKIFQGHYDNRLIQSVQQDINKFTQPEFATNNIKPMRWIVNIEGNPTNWGAERHFRKIVGNVVTGENGVVLSDHYDHHIGAGDKWVGIAAIWNTVSNPFMKWNYTKVDDSFVHDSITYISPSIWKTQNLYQGYNKSFYDTSSTGFLNRFNSQYETFLRDYSKTVIDARTVSDSLYKAKEYIGNSGGHMSLQAFWEDGLYDKLINPYHSGFIYSDKPWYGQSFIQQHNAIVRSFYLKNGVLDSSDIVLLNAANKRQNTAEEIDLMQWFQLIMGAKGLIYDGGHDYVQIPNTSDAQLKLLPLESDLIGRFGNITIDSLHNIDNYDFINSPNLTRDYFDSINYRHILQNHGKIDSLKTISYFMNGDSNLTNRIYVGKRSVRNKLYQLHNWVRANEDELMKLKLQAWYGKGYKIWENHHPDVDTNFLTNYIDKDRIRTRKIYVADSINGNRLNKNGNSYLEPGNTYDDFVDLTLLKHKDISTDSIIYVGVQSRRADPTIYFTEVANDKHFLFLSYSEFEDLCKNGGKNPLRLNDTIYPASVWQKYWWKKLGARELTIPLKNSMENKMFDGTYYEVAELGADNDTLNANFWRQPKYYDLVDTIITNRDTLKIRFLPGDGKILKTEPKKLFTSSDENDSTDCESCEAFTKNIKISRSSQSGTNPKCFSIYIQNDSDCDYSDMNIVLKINGITNASISSSNYLSLNTQIISGQQVVSIKGTLDNNTTKSLSFCVPPNNPNFNYQLFAGRYVKGQFVLCDDPLSEYEYVDSCKDCSTITANVLDKNDSCECACDYRIQGNIGTQSGSCPLTTWGYDLIENGDTTSLTGLSFTGGIMFGQDICLGDGTYKLKINFYRNGQIACSKYVEKECNLCDSINVHQERLITEGGINYNPNTYRFNIDLNNLQNCVSEVKRYFLNELNQAIWVETKPFFSSQTITWQTLIHQEAQKFIFLNSAGDTICSKIINIPDLTCGGFPSNTDIINIGDIENSGSMCCLPLVLKDTSSNYNDIYSIIVYDPISMIPYYSEARDPSYAAPIDLSSGYYLTDICTPNDSTLQYGILFYDSDTTLVNCMNFDSLCTSYNRRSYSYIEDLSSYPNPAIDKMTVSYELKEEADVEIELLDHKGDLISSEKLKTQNAGKYTFDFDFTNTKVSIIYILLRANGEEKILKQLIYK